MKNNRRVNDEAERNQRRQRRRKRSSSEPLKDATESAEKREALKRLFGKICSLEAERERMHEEEYDSASEYGNENDDPLLDSVPVDMDPEQLGFLVCAQETLRFLHGRGIPVEDPMFTRLRSRLLRGIDELAMA